MSKLRFAESKILFRLRTFPYIRKETINYCFLLRLKKNTLKGQFIKSNGINIENVAFFKFEARTLVSCIIESLKLRKRKIEEQIT